MTAHSAKHRGGGAGLLSILARLRPALNFITALAVTFLGLLAITFFIGRVIPIDPVLSVVGERAPREVYEAARKAMGLDKPLIEQFFIYLWQVLHGDLGYSLLTSHPVLEDIKRVVPATFELATVATLLGVITGIPFGVIAAVKAGRWPDHIIRVMGLIGYSVPVFWLGLMGLLLFYGKLGWVSGPGRLDIFYDGVVPQVTGMILIDSLLAGEGGIFRNAVSHIILPASMLGYYSLAYISRMTRSFMIEQLGQEYITTARVKGMSEARVIWKHALGNVMVPLITVIALSYAALLEGSVLTETVFAWPGLGFYITTALMSADMSAVLGGTIVVGMVFVGLNLFSDFLYRFFDPRAKA